MRYIHFSQTTPPPPLRIPAHGPNRRIFRTNSVFSFNFCFATVRSEFGPRCGFDFRRGSDGMCFIDVAIEKVRKYHLRRTICECGRRRRKSRRLGLAVPLLKRALPDRHDGTTTKYEYRYTAKRAFEYDFDSYDVRRAYCYDVGIRRPAATTYTFFTRVNDIYAMLLVCCVRFTDDRRAKRAHV